MEANKNAERVSDHRTLLHSGLPPQLGSLQLSPMKPEAVYPIYSKSGELEYIVKKDLLSRKNIVYKVSEADVEEVARLVTKQP